jgi:diphthamide synthase (EF-2-diphthine--ammonia ligase)
VSWSSGKDSAFALRTARAEGLTVVDLLTTVGPAFARVPVHDVEHEFAAARAVALGLRLRTVALPWPCPNDVYRDRVRAALVAEMVDTGLRGVVTAVDLEQGPARLAER